MPLPSFGFSYTYRFRRATLYVAYLLSQIYGEPDPNLHIEENTPWRAGTVRPPAAVNAAWGWLNQLLDGASNGSCESASPVVWRWVGSALRPTSLRLTGRRMWHCKFPKWHLDRMRRRHQIEIASSIALCAGRPVQRTQRAAACCLPCLGARTSPMILLPTPLRIHCNSTSNSS